MRAPKAVRRSYWVRGGGLHWGWVREWLGGLSHWRVAGVRGWIAWPSSSALRSPKQLGDAVGVEYTWMCSRRRVVNRR